MVTGTSEELACKHLALHLVEYCQCELCRVARQAVNAMNLQTQQYYWGLADKIKEELRGKYGKEA